MVMRLLSAVAIATAFSFAAPAMAAVPVCDVTAPTTDLTLNAASSFNTIMGGGCAGFYAGNGNGGNPSDIAAQQAALALIGGTRNQSVGLSVSGSTFSFAAPITGLIYLGVHFGNGTGSPDHSTPGGTTAFYAINAVNLSSITTHFSGLSNAVLYSQSRPAVPEPATWAMMLVGFGAAGVSLRRRKRMTLQAA